MSFFPPDPDPGESEQDESPRSPWWSVPNDELPAIYGVSQMLAITEHVAIALVGVYVYRDGVEFRVERRLRRHGVSGSQWREQSAAFMEHWPGGRTGKDDRLRYGLVLSDGQRLVDGMPFIGGSDPTAQPDGHVLTRSGGGTSGDDRVFSGYDGLWLWPAPPAGPVELVVQWPAMRIAETRVHIAAGPILDLISRAAPIWD
jgi:hypothetical protein